MVDPAGNVKELGPLNSNTTKVGVIHSDAVPTLGFTNPNAQVDLTAIYTQTGKALDGNLWYTSAGCAIPTAGAASCPSRCSSPVCPPGARYTGVDQTSQTAAAALIAACNPWANRQAGDFLILWDQSGSSLEVFKRVFTGTAPNLTLGPATSLGSAVAQFSADGFRGEAAINLTDDVFPPGGACQTFANTIPGTVTGNSDTADYKDAVLNTFPPVTNCGTVTIKKVVDQGTGTFKYRLAAGGAAIFNTGQIDGDCDQANPSSSLTLCHGALSVPNPAQGAATDTDTISNLKENDTNWTLTEDTPGADFSLTSIVWDLGATTYNLVLAGVTQASPVFTVEAGKTTACTITNAFVKTTPSQTTSQVAYAQISDSINLTLIKAGAADANSAKVTFRLYSNATCTTQVGAAEEVSLTYGVGGTTASASMTTTRSVVIGSTYYWRVEYSGDAFNNGFTTPCGQETAVVSVVFVGQ